MEEQPTYAAFVGENLMASGPLETVLPILKARFDAGENALVLVFENQTGRQVDFDLRGSLAELIARAAPAPVRTGPGRPRLGVVSREVSLLPSHWEWLEQQPNGASATLRRLVDQAARHDPGEQRARRAREATSRFLTAIAGNLAGYEEANRALYRGHSAQFEEQIRNWPPDIRDHARSLAQDAFIESAATRSHQTAT